VKEFGKLDILVNNAAEQHEVEEPLEIDTSQLERTFRTNVFGYFYMAKAALWHIKAGGAIVNSTSVTAYKGHKTLIDYAATKGAIVAFTRSLSEAVIEKGIRVNAVAPGPIWTPLIPASFDAQHVAKHGEASPMGRAGQPNEVAPCYVFLASEEASYISGQVLHPNGGTIVNS
jgi:NAD(P)-dependent dehydrogenase (short-subunit alcohol dehydrogenase family)